MGSASRSQGSAKASSTRSHNQSNVPVPTNRALPSIQVTPTRPQEVQIAPRSPTSPISPTSEDPSREGSAGRRPSVPDRSPLQKLEGKLDDISKEERRARIQEAEIAAQEKAEMERAARRARNAASSQQRNVSGPERTGAAPARTASNRRNVSMPIQGTDQPQDDDPVVDLTPPWDPSQPASTALAKEQRHNSGHVTAGSQRQKARTSYFEGAGNIATNSKGKDPVGVSRGGSFRERSAPSNASPDEATHKQHRRGYSVATAAAATGLGLSGLNETSHGQRLATGGTISRYDSKRLSKDLPPTPKDSTSSRDSRGIAAAQRQMEQEHRGQSQGKRAMNAYQQFDPLPAEAVHNSQGVPKFDSSPQSATGQIARDGTGFGRTESERTARKAHTQHHHHLHLPDSLHRSHDRERRSQAPVSFDEWKIATAATLLAKDLDLDTPGSTDAQKLAWWEQSGTQRKRRPSASQEAGHDGSYEMPTAQTTFNPPLYLKCGPLLRFTGIRKDTDPAGQDRDIWRGSVMIVTIDDNSSYKSPPTLRLFKQPMDLLPPPPAELDAESGQQLDPEYVDPLAGQVKVSRSGKTLYVKPVEELEVETDLSRIEDDTGLFEESRSTPYINGAGATQPKHTRILQKDGEKLGKVREVPGIRLHAERGVTFWRFNIEVELGSQQARIAYRINRGPAIGFWVPARGETMNMMFYSCNGFSLSVDPNQFCGPDPLWRDVLNNHQTRPFHVMIGGGDQIYNDRLTRDCSLFREWTNRSAVYKHSAEFSSEMQNELEEFYLDRYSMWFSQGLFSMANSQIPMVNIWDDHDIIDGYGSYPHHFMTTPVFSGLGAVAFKYYMLFQHQSVTEETQQTEPSWLLGAHPGPYINQYSRSVFMLLGRKVALLGLDCRTERQRDEVLSEDTYELVFDRCRQEIIKGETKHLIVLLGIPIAYPRLNFLEMILTSRLMDPIKALGRTGILGGFVNKFDGGVEILDDLDDHWTAKHHKAERGWFIESLQELAAEKGVRVTILGGDVHLAAIGQFYSNKKLRIPKDRDHRYMPNIISSAIVNTPPPDMMADILNKRNKVHHLDPETDEDMIPIFTHDVDGKARNNKHLLPRRNWCSLREYHPGTTPPTSRSPSPSGGDGLKLTRTFSDYAPGKLVRRISRSGGPPPAYYNNPNNVAAEENGTGRRRNSLSRWPRASIDGGSTRSRRSSLSRWSKSSSADAIPPPGSSSSSAYKNPRASLSADPSNPPRPNPFHRRPTGHSDKAAAAAQQGHINLEHGLDVVLNVEVSQRDPAGITAPYRLLIPALDYRAPAGQPVDHRRKSRVGALFGRFGASGSTSYSGTGSKKSSRDSGAYDDVRGGHDSEGEEEGEEDEEEDPAHHGYAPPGAGLGPPGLAYGGAAGVGLGVMPPLQQPQQQQRQQQQMPRQQQQQQAPQHHHRRAMGGILGKERDDRFEHDAHVATHTRKQPHMMSGANGRGGAVLPPPPLPPPVEQQGRPSYVGAGQYAGGQGGFDDYDDDEEQDQRTEGSLTPTGPPPPKKKWMIWK